MVNFVHTKGDTSDLRFHILQKNIRSPVQCILEQIHKLIDWVWHDCVHDVSFVRHNLYKIHAGCRNN